jgi:hypothetical protein
MIAAFIDVIILRKSHRAFHLRVFKAGWLDDTQTVAVEKELM